MFTLRFGPSPDHALPYGNVSIRCRRLSHVSVEKNCPLQFMAEARGLLVLMSFPEERG